MEAFATYAELGKQINRVFAPGTEAEWITSLLESASAYLREDVIGAQVFPTSQSTFTAYPDGGRVDLPTAPVRTIDSVTREGKSVDYIRRDDTLYVDCDEPVKVAFTYGYSEAPESLKRWACVLVSQSLIPIELKLGMTAGGLSSLAIDDFKVAFADAGEATGMNLSDRNIDLIRSRFSAAGAHVVSMR
jgi:hypothetical protein